MITVFEYRYRDAGNFKAYGSIALAGELTSCEQDCLRNCFEVDGQFVAEQIDVPTLYAELYKWSDGPIDDDLCCHEFVALSVVDDSDVPENARRVCDGALVMGTPNTVSPGVVADKYPELLVGERQCPIPARMKPLAFAFARLKSCSMREC